MTDVTVPTEPVFYCRDGLYVPSASSGSPWSPTMIHGGAAAGLLAHTIETSIDDPAMHVVRLTVDLFKPVPKVPLDAHATVIREGRRIKAVVASLFSEGEETCRATALLLRRAEQAPDGWEADNEHIGPAPTAAEGPSMAHALRGNAEAAAARKPLPGFSNPGFHVVLQAIQGKANSDPQNQPRWLRVPVPMVDGVPLTPLVRAAAVADLGGMGRPRTSTTNLINADISLYLHRLPEGEWIGIAPQDGGLGPGGLAVARSIMFDSKGAAGFIQQALLINAPPKAPAPVEAPSS